ncbi:VOC family protein [Neobacillus niacini]|uniref:VOC family protein n=1 Tax=Neobacillus niacini TaxID=86668 RepID=UPI0021CB9871|nr:VOC family protein [Neobacillus niacini]MCM3766735.1 VOC family protein [Neobacillus niacini]
MQFSFDHLVWFSKKPEDAIAPLEQLGIRVIRGGRHETWGTYNTLSYFGLSYLEFLGIEDLKLAETHHENRLITHIVERLPKENGKGPATVAIRTDRMEELAERLKREGLTVYGPIPGERVRTDGQTIRWSLLFPELDSEGLKLPFFIQWEKSDEERLAEFQEQALLNGQPKFESVGVAVHDLNKTAAAWGKLLNLNPTEEFIDPNLNARCRKLTLQGTELLFCSPLGDGPAADVLKQKGETPFLIALSETRKTQFLEMLNGYWQFQ